MLIIGSHVGFRKDDQLLGSLKEALSYGANTFMFYTGAPQNTKRYPIMDGLTLEALNLMKEHNIDYSKVIVHAPYIVNLANNSDPEKYMFAVDFLREELERCSLLGIKNVVLHPGSHVGLGVEQGITNIANALNMVLGTSDVRVLLETMAGKGSEIGSKLEEIKAIIDLVDEKDKIGVCLDTCHLSDAGYDISNFDKFLDEFQSGLATQNLKEALYIGWQSVMYDMSEISFNPAVLIVTIPMVLHVLFIVSISYLPRYIREKTAYRYFKEHPEMLEGVRRVIKKKCPNCNASNSEGKDNCAYCGTLLTEVKGNVEYV